MSSDSLPAASQRAWLKRPLHALWACLLLLTGLRVFAGLHPDLAEDAAHYALYGYYPALSYFDHPPLIGWLQFLVERISSSNLALRAWPMALMAASSAVLYRLARTLFPEASPWLGLSAVLVMQSAVMIQLMGLSMLPDDPMLLFWLLSALALYRTLVLGEARHWPWVGLWFGLAGLSKGTAVTLVASAIVLMITERRWTQLRTPWPWLAILIALALISPVLWWNAQHDWIWVRYQLMHVGEPRPWQWRRFGISQAIQCVAYSPGIYLFGYAAVVLALRRLHDARMRLLLAIALPLFLFIDGASGVEVSLPHWTSAGWATLSILIAWLLHRYWHRSRLVRIGVYVSAAYSALLIGALFFFLGTSFNPFPANRNPLAIAGLYGWQRVAAEAEHLRRDMAKTPGPKPVLYAGNWSYASQLAWYARPVPVQITDHKLHQMTLWYGNAARGGRGILVVPQHFQGKARAWQAKFAHCDPAKAVPIEVGGKLATTYHLYRCQGYLG